MGAAHTPQGEPVDQPMPEWVKRLLGAAALAVVAWLLLTQVIFKSGDSDKSAQVRAAAGASTCQRTAYQMINRLDGSKTTIYDCYFPNGRERCVTMSDGITRDATAEVRLLFEGTLGASKPSCLG